MTTVKWKFHERWRLRRKSHKFNPGSAFWSWPRLKLVHHSRAKAKARLHHAQARSVSPDEGGDQWGWGFQMLPMWFFPNARIHEQYITCFIKSFYPRLLTLLEHATFSSLILYSYDLKAYPYSIGVNMVKSQTGSKVKAQPLSFQHKLVENKS